MKQYQVLEEQNNMLAKQGIELRNKGKKIEELQNIVRGRLKTNLFQPFFYSKHINVFFLL